jgi:hypothetical protein
MRDSNGNSSKISFGIRPTPVVKEVPTLESMIGTLFSDITENTLSVSSVTCKEAGNKAKVYEEGTMIEKEPDYYNVNRAVYLFDLRKTKPDSIVVCGRKVVPDIDQVVPSGTSYKYYNDVLTVDFPQDALYDTLYLSTNYRRGMDSLEYFSIGDRTIPLKKGIIVSLKPEKKYAADPNYGVYRVAGRGFTYLGGEWSNGNVNFVTREFGEFTILQDKTPPTIKALNVDRTGARFKIKDNLSGISSFEANINGQWLLMHYDSKSSTIWSEKLNKKIPLTGNFELLVTDNAGNQSRFTKKIL